MQPLLNTTPPPPPTLGRPGTCYMVTLCFKAVPSHQLHIESSTHWHIGSNLQNLSGQFFKCEYTKLCSVHNIQDPSHLQFTTLFSYVLIYQLIEILF